jgi:hypothetical protein
MKKVIILFASILIGNFVFSQNSAGKTDDAGRIAINAYVPEGMGDMTPTACKALQSRLDRIVTKNGIGGSPLNQRFVLTANAVELTKDITPTEPPIYSYTLEINLVIGDVVTGTKFAATAIERKGSGKSETKAYMKAIKAIAPKSKKYNDFLEEGKTKIIEYYNANCDFFLKEATTLSDQKKYDEAIAKLVSVPDVCKECYDKAMDQSTLVYKAKMENECQENIAQAKASIATDDWEGAASFISGYTPDLACYPQIEEIMISIKDHKCAKAMAKAQAAWANQDSREASAFLGEIPGDSKCAPEAKEMLAEIKDFICEKAMGEANAAWANRDASKASAALANVASSSKCASDAKALTAQIASKLDAIEKRDWDQKMKEQERNWSVEDREFKNKVNQQNNDVALRKADIERMRQVGIAAAKNQPKVINKVMVVKGWF